MVRLWDAATGQERSAVLKLDAEAADLAFSPNGRHIAAGADQAVKVWEVATGREVLQLRGHAGPVPDLACSPDIRLAHTGSRAAGADVPERRTADAGQVTASGRAPAAGGGE
jgi:WD40 repeat protein